MSSKKADGRDWQQAANNGRLLVFPKSNVCQCATEITKEAALIG